MTLQDWVTAAAAELDLDPADVPVGAVLDLARDVAHRVVRPGAPVSAYLMGLAVGRGADPAEVTARLGALAERWPPPRPEDERPGPEGERPGPEGERSGPEGEDRQVPDPGDGREGAGAAR